MLSLEERRRDGSEDDPDREIHAGRRLRGGVARGRRAQGDRHRVPIASALRVVDRLGVRRDRGPGDRRLLHDTAEDHGGLPRLASIKAEFGDDVANIVEQCSDSLLAEGEEKDPWWVRKVRYLDHLEQSGSDVALVSAADKLHNASSVLADYRDRRRQGVRAVQRECGTQGNVVALPPPCRDPAGVVSTAGVGPRDRARSAR